MISFWCYFRRGSNILIGSNKIVESNFTLTLIKPTSFSKKQEKRPQLWPGLISSKYLNSEEVSLGIDVLSNDVASGYTTSFLFSEINSTFKPPLRKNNTPFSILYFPTLMRIRSTFRPWIPPFKINEQPETFRHRVYNLI